MLCRMQYLHNSVVLRNKFIFILVCEVRTRQGVRISRKGTKHTGVYLCKRINLITVQVGRTQHHYAGGCTVRGSHLFFVCTALHGSLILQERYIVQHITKQDTHEKARYRTGHETYTIKYTYCRCTCYIFPACKRVSV